MVGRRLVRRWWGWGWYGYMVTTDPTYETGSRASHRRAAGTGDRRNRRIAGEGRSRSWTARSVGFASDYNGRWDKLSVAPGPHTITFRAKGYRSLVVDFEARPGATYTFTTRSLPATARSAARSPPAGPAAPQETPAHSPAPVATGRLRIHAEPADSAVYLDGEYLGLGADLSRIHGSLAVGIGTHRLEVVRPGFASAVRTIDVDGTDPSTVELRLEPEH